MSITPREQPVRGFFLLASGSSSLWDVEIHQFMDREEWFIDLDGPTVYFTFYIPNLQIIRQIIEFLQQHLGRPSGRKQPRWTEENDALRLGTFTQSPVELLWDDEGDARCFLVVCSSDTSAIRLTLQRDDIEMLLAALQQVANEMSE